MLAFLSSVAKGVPQKLEVMCQLVSSLFDLNPNISSYMKVGKGGGGCWGFGGCMLTMYMHGPCNVGVLGEHSLSKLCVGRGV